MNDIIFKKIYSEQPDSELLQLKITASSKYVSASQTCYVTISDLLNTISEISNYLSDHSSPKYIQYGYKTGAYTPAFSMNILPADVHGHLLIDVDLEVEDHLSRCHRCGYYVETELGQIERFGDQLRRLIHGPVGTEVRLAQEDRP